MLRDLRDVKTWGKNNKDRIFIAGSYEPKILGILEHISHSIGRFRGNSFYPILLKNFETFENVKQQNEPQWFKVYKAKKLPLFRARLENEGVMMGRYWNRRSRAWKNLMATTLFLLDQCSFVFFELTSPGFGTMDELIITLLVYRKSFLFYFVQSDHSMHPDVEPLVNERNLFWYHDYEHLKEVVVSCLKTLAIVKKSI